MFDLLGAQIKKRHDLKGSVPTLSTRYHRLVIRRQEEMEVMLTVLNAWGITPSIVGAGS